MRTHFNFIRKENRYLITNDFGNYAFLSNSEFQDLVKDNIHINHQRYDELARKFFVFDTSQEEFIESSVNALRYAKKYMLSATQLFIFVVTTNCNLNCIYCQAKDKSVMKHGFMDKNVASRAINILLSSPAEALTIEFQGGEPLENFAIIKYIVEEIENRNITKDIRFSLVSNLLLLTEDISDFLKKHNIGISTSIDGNREVHDYNRHTFSKKGTYDEVIRKINDLRNKGMNVGAIETTTRNSLGQYKEIIDADVENKLDVIFIRPLTPLGVASLKWEDIGYSEDEFIEFYKQSIQYLLELNKRGIEISEGHASIFLSKILRGNGLNYMELRSPCGASIGQMAFNYDGNIYTCDEGRMIAEMGDQSFKIGTVNDDYISLVSSNACKICSSASVIEALPECCGCVYQPYCGICPVVNYALDGDVFARQSNNYKCKIYKGMLDVLFSILEKEDKQEMEILYSWCED